MLKILDRQTVEIESLFMSCRILGKKIENAFILFVLNKLKEENFLNIKATYTFTTKNIQTKDFYEKIGFTVLEEGIECKQYLMNLQDKHFRVEPYYRIISE